MNVNVLNSAGIDYLDGVQRCAGNAALYEKILIRFSCETDKINKLKALYSDKSYDKLFEIVHDLKGVSGNLSMHMLFNASNDLVGLLRANKYDELEDAVNALKSAYDKTIEAVQNSLGE